jgi:two-component system, sensor histidine kinase ChiS
VSSRRIVVANDDPVYLDLIKELLIEEGYSDVICFAGPGAFDVIRQELPALVLLDINITNPGVGWRTLDMLRLHRATRNIPVIVCSTDGRMLQEKAEWLVGLRCDTLEKPFDLDALLGKVVSILGSSSEQTDGAGKRGT